MKFTQTPLAGAFVIELTTHNDTRGFFARTFCRHEFRSHGLKPDIAQSNVAFNARRGTLRGMHFQFPPRAETKLVRATRGRILDVIVDLRPESATFLSSFQIELSEENHKALYVPERFAHGYQTLEDGTETTYQVGEFYAPEAEGGLSPLEPELALNWPLPIAEMSDKDRSWPPLRTLRSDIERRMSILEHAE